MRLADGEKAATEEVLKSLEEAFWDSIEHQGIKRQGKWLKGLWWQIEIESWILSFVYSDTVKEIWVCFIVVHWTAVFEFSIQFQVQVAEAVEVYWQE